jgi:hypothetical protein
VKASSSSRTLLSTPFNFIISFTHAMLNYRNAFKSGCGFTVISSNDT